MLHQSSIRLALVALIAATPAPGFVDAAFAGSSSRSETRHNLTGDEAAETTSARSSKRRANRGSSSAEETQVSQNRGKRSRRAPAKTEDAPAMIAKAEVVETDLISIAQNNSDAIAKHIRSGEFEGATGTLALYQLTGKAVANMPLTPAEMKALASVTKETDLGALVKKTEMQLIEVTGDATTLDAIAAALGIPRPSLDPSARPNLGASLITQEDASNG